MIQEISPKHPQMPPQILPDVAVERPDLLSAGALDWVGMQGIEVPVLLKNQMRTAAKANAFVSLENSQARGIHMSRLFKDLQEGLLQKTLSLSGLAEIVGHFLRSHEGLSQKAKLEIEFQALLERQTLRSAQSGWRTYPVKMSVVQERGHEPRSYLETRIVYSSTCPASAALSRQLIQENFKNIFLEKEIDFAEVHSFLGTSQGIVATPHAQRSEARVKVEVDAKMDFDYEQLIGLIEEALQTAVQSLVKREDEQEFALRNGQNLMFCEDAARRVQIQLTKEKAILDFIAQMRHFESLHPHDAVSRVSRGRELQQFE